MGATPIADLLAEAGFVAETERILGRVALESCGLTRPGKTGIDDAKTPQARAILAARFAFTCPSCASAVRTSRAPGVHLIEVTDGRCQRCAGSQNRIAALRFIEACRRAGSRRLLVVGGSPSTREALAREISGAVELRIVDGTARIDMSRAQGLFDWADVVVVWGATQLDHRVSDLFTRRRDAKVVLVRRRGLGALLDAATAHLARR